MSELNVQIVTLNPMRVASAYGFGTNPEEQAWQKLAIWAKPLGFLDDKIKHPIFGFNNPNPSPGIPKYGYEFWMKVDSETIPEGEIRVVEFMGGSYAVLQCEAQGNPEKIPAAWQSLTAWCKSHNYRFGQHQALEKIISSPDDPVGLVLELYCPIIE